MTHFVWLRRWHSHSWWKTNSSLPENISNIRSNLANAIIIIRSWDKKIIFRLPLWAITAKCAQENGGCVCVRIHRRHAYFSDRRWHAYVRTLRRHTYAVIYLILYWQCVGNIRLNEAKKYSRDSENIFCTLLWSCCWLRMQWILVLVSVWGSARAHTPAH